VAEEFTVEVGVAWVVWVHGDGCIAEHGFWTGGGDDDAFVCNGVRSTTLLNKKIRTAADNLVCETGQYAKLEFLLWVIVWYTEEGAAFEFFLLDLEVGEGCVELDAPVDEAVCAVEDAVFVESAESLDDGFAEFLW